MKNKFIATALVITSALLAFGLNAAAEVKKPIANAGAVDGFFTEAKKSFEAKDNAMASSSIDKAAELLSDQAKASTAPKYGKPLTRQAAKLTTLASNVKEGKVTDSADLDEEFAKTHNVLSAYFQGRSKRSLAGKAMDKAAGAMNATANHIEKTAKWSGQKLSDGGKETVDLLRKTSGAIVSGTGTAVEKTGEVLKSGLKLVTQLGENIEEGAKKGGKKAKGLGGRLKGEE